MKHILINPSNGAPIDHDGVKLAPGQALHVLKHVGEAFIKRFEFLMLQLVPGTDAGVAKAKPVKVSGTLEWQPVVAPATAPEPDAVNHVITKSAKAPATAKKAAKKVASKPAAASK